MNFNLTQAVMASLVFPRRSMLPLDAVYRTTCGEATAVAQISPPVQEMCITNGRRFLGWQLRQESAQLGCGFELGNGVHFLECGCERIRKAPHCPW